MKSLHPVYAISRKLQNSFTTFEASRLTVSYSGLAASAINHFEEFSMKSICAAFIALLAAVPTTAWADTALEWNKRAMTAATTANQSASDTARAIATLQSAMSAAMKAVQQGNVANPAARSLESSRSAAAAIAAFAILENLFPDQILDLEIWLAVSLADIPESQAKADALLAGRKAANEMLSRRVQ